MGKDKPQPKPQRNTPRKRLCGCGQWYDPKNDAESTAHASHTG